MNPDDNVPFRRAAGIRIDIPDETWKTITEEFRKMGEAIAALREPLSHREIERRMFEMDMAMNAPRHDPVRNCPGPDLQLYTAKQIGRMIGEGVNLGLVEDELAPLKRAFTARNANVRRAETPSLELADRILGEAW